MRLMRVELTQLECLQLMSAGHALRMPSGFYGVTHRRARSIIKDILGFCPKGAPESGSINDCLKWLGLTEEPSAETA
jgi:hypothetical protein